MLDVEVLIFKFVTVNGFASETVEVGDVTTLCHEAWNDSVEDRVLVSETLLASAQGSEVLCSLWNNLVEQVEDHSWLFSAIDGDVEVDLRELGRGGGKLSLSNVEHCIVVC